MNKKFYTGVGAIFVALIPALCQSQPLQIDWFGPSRAWYPQATGTIEWRAWCRLLPEGEIPSGTKMAIYPVCGLDFGGGNVVVPLDLSPAKPVQALSFGLNFKGNIAPVAFIAPQDPKMVQATASTAYVGGTETGWVKLGNLGVGLVETSVGTVVRWMVPDGIAWRTVGVSAPLVTVDASFNKGTRHKSILNNARISTLKPGVARITGQCGDGARVNVDLTAATLTTLRADISYVAKGSLQVWDASLFDLRAGDADTGNGIGIVPQVGAFPYKYNDLTAATPSSTATEHSAPLASAWMVMSGQSGGLAVQPVEAGVRNVSSGVNWSFASPNNPYLQNNVWFRVTPQLPDVLPMALGNGQSINVSVRVQISADNFSVEPLVWPWLKNRSVAWQNLVDALKPLADTPAEAAIRSGDMNALLAPYLTTDFDPNRVDAQTAQMAVNAARTALLTADPGTWMLVNTWLNNANQRMYGRDGLLDSSALLLPEMASVAMDSWSSSGNEQWARCLRDVTTVGLSLNSQKLQPWAGRLGSAYLLRNGLPLSDELAVKLPPANAIGQVQSRRVDGGTWTGCVSACAPFGVSNTGGFSVALTRDGAQLVAISGCPVPKGAKFAGAAMSAGDWTYQLDRKLLVVRVPGPGSLSLGF